MLPPPEVIAALPVAGLWAALRHRLGRRDYFVLALCVGASVVAELCRVVFAWLLSSLPADSSVHSWLGEHPTWSNHPPQVVGDRASRAEFMLSLARTARYDLAIGAIWPALLVLLHTVFSTSLLPFSPPSSRPWGTVVRDARETGVLAPSAVITLQRRGGAALAWAVATVAAAPILVGLRGDQSVDMRTVIHEAVAFVFTSGLRVAVLATLFGATIQRAETMTLVVGVPLRWAMEACLSYVATCDSGINVKPPHANEHLARLLISSVGVVLVCQLIAHVHTLLVLCPDLPPCPPLNPFRHFALVQDVIFSPPEVDAHMLASLVDTERSLSNPLLTIATQAFPRALRIPLVAVLAWCNVTYNLASASIKAPDDETISSRRRALASIQLHLVQSWDSETPDLERVFTLCTIPHLPAADHAAFHLFSTLVPRLAPVYPFLEFCRALAIDASFLPKQEDPNWLVVRLANPDFDIEPFLPIKTQDQLDNYTSATGGSVAAAVCYLTWSVLKSCPENPTEPAQSLFWTESVHPKSVPDAPPLALGSPMRALRRAHTVVHMRLLGQATDIICVAKHLAKTAAEGRVYVPLSSLRAVELLSILAPEDGEHPSPRIVLALLDQADRLRAESDNAINGLPRTARQGAQGIVDAWFGVAEQIRRKGGVVGFDG